MSNLTRVATRPTTTGTKMYIHVNCSCTRINGKTLKDIDTVAAAEAFAAENDFPTTFCKTSVIEEAAPVETVEVAEEVAPVETVEEVTEEEPAAPVAEGPEFTVEVDNRDQYGKQRRTAVEAVADAVGAQTTFVGVKNRHKTGNDAFRVTVTGGPADLEKILRNWLLAVELDLTTVIAKAKEEAKTMEGATANQKQKAWKLAVRNFIAEAGMEKAVAVAMAR